MVVRFCQEHAPGQYLNSKAHAPVIKRDEDIPSTVRTKPAGSSTLSFRPTVLMAMDFDNKPAKEVNFPRQEDPTSNLYIITPLPRQ